MVRALVGIDGSELSRHAARRARAVLRDGARLTLVTVVKPPPPTTIGAGDVTPMGVYVEDAREDQLGSMVREAEAELVAWAGELEIDPADTVVLPGDPGPTLCDHAASGRFDVVVVGSHGTGMLKQVLLGSVSQHVLHHAHCLVLVVPDDTAGHRAGGLLHRRRSRPAGP